jgi:hypothetical protein
MRKFSKKSAIALISASFAGIGVVLACAGGWYTIEDQTNFTPEVYVDKSYSPFIYSWDGFYFTGYDDDYNNKFSKEIVKDWYVYLDKKVPENEIETILFTTTRKGIDSLKAGKIPSSLAGSKLVTLMSDKKSKEFFNYLFFAKKAEIFSLSQNSDWSSKETWVRELGGMDVYIKSLDGAYKNCKDEFIKQRFLFQLVRAYFFKGDNKTGVALFEKESLSAKKNSTYYRTLSYAAGSIKREKDIAKSNYYYSLVYNGSEILKTAAHFSFKPQNETDFQQTLAMCKTNDEKCTLWQMLGMFYKDEVRSIKEIMKIDPKSDKLDILLSRAVNKIELTLFDEGQFTGYESNDVAIKKNLELQAVIKELIKGEMKKPEQWYTALGYLQTLDKKYTEAEETFFIAKKKTSADKNALAEVRLFELINSISRLTKIDSKSENALLPEFNWLEEIAKEGSGIKIRTTNLSMWIHKIMAKKYRDQGDLQKAEFFSEKLEFYNNKKQLHDMQNFLLKENKTPYEFYCAKIYRYKVEDLYEYEAIEEAINDNLETAISIMEKAGKNGIGALPSNPFNGGIKDCHDCDHALPQKNPYTKLSTLKKMKEMKDKLATDTYNNALLLANAFYNLNYYGSSRLFYNCAVSDADRYSEMTLPIKYYTMALGAAKTDEQKAKCTYMLAKCERNVWYNKNPSGDYYKVAFIPFKNFVELKKYSSTKYYQEVIKECGYFKSYARK